MSVCVGIQNSAYLLRHCWQYDIDNVAHSGLWTVISIIKCVIYISHHDVPWDYKFRKYLEIFCFYEHIIYNSYAWLISLYGFIEKLHTLVIFIFISINFGPENAKHRGCMIASFFSFLKIGNRFVFGLRINPIYFVLQLMFDLYVKAREICIDFFKLQIK